MVRLHAPLWGALLAFVPALFALQCSLEGLGDGVRPSGADGGNDASSFIDAGGAHPSAAIITGLSAPDELAIGPDFLYFTTAREGGAVERCSIRGCNAEPEVVAPRQSDPRALTVATIAQSVMLGWVNSAGGTVMLASRGVGAANWLVHPLATEQPSPAGIAIWGNDDAVWTNLDARAGTAGVVRRVGPQSPIRALSRKAVKPGPVILPPDSQDVVWGDANGLAETTLDGDGADAAAPCPIVISDAGVKSLVTAAADGLALYWATLDGQIMSTHRPTAQDALKHCDDVRPEVVTLASGQGTIASIAVDALFVYFTVHEGGKGSLRAVSIGERIVQVLLDDLNDPRGIVTDESYIYVAVRGDGTIRRLVRSGT